MLSLRLVLIDSYGVMSDSILLFKKTTKYSVPGPSVFRNEAYYVCQAHS